MPPLSPSPLRTISTITTSGLRHRPPRHSTCLHLRPALSHPLTPHRNKTSRSETNLSELLEKQASQEAERRRPAALRWARPDRDEGINSRMIILIDDRTNSLSRPEPLARTLRSIDRKNEFVIKVGKSGSEEDALPLCKILSKKEVHAKEAAKLKAQSEQAKEKKRREGKTMELGWATADHDLTHRFRKARQVLEGGERVNFLIENRRRRTVVPHDKAKFLLGQIKEAMEEVPRVVEVGREGELGKKFKVVFGFKGE